MKEIKIKGARVHNLKDIDVSIPKNQIVVATGVSGSGKSSLVFDIIFEEGRRQYLRSLGMLSGLVEENSFEQISGIGPTIAVQQSIIRQSNPRSTVGSRTGILNILAVLFAGEGRISCSACGNSVNNRLICGNCGNIEERLEAGYFSYNAPNGMCMQCSGRGAYSEINFKKLVPTKSTTLQQVYDAVGITPGYMKLLNRHFKAFMNRPFSQIPDDVKQEIIYGHRTSSNSERTSFCLTKLFLHRSSRGEDLKGYFAMSPCPECQGARVGAEARRVFLNRKHIGDLANLSITELQVFFELLLKEKGVSSFGKNLLKELLRKTRPLITSRLGHLSLYRAMPTLSGGEIQRLFLYSHLSSEMDSLIYILDEPTVGLHESEKAQLLKSIQALKALGNTVIVVEHDRGTIELADHIIDIGPGAGVEGGKVMFQGDLAGLLNSKKSITGRYLSGKIPMPERTLAQAAFDNKGPALTIRNAGTNNLKGVTVSLPLGALVGIAGVSGSGKSSLISDTLVPLLKGYFFNQRERDKAEGLDDDEEAEPDVIYTLADNLEGVDFISGFAEVSQAPIGRHMNSNPVSYIGVWDKIRKLFAGTPEGKRQNLSPGHFSFNSKGACSECGGSGREKIWLGSDFFIYNSCRECQGKRFNNTALSVLFQDKNIFDVLDMSVADAVTFFADFPAIISTLEVMDRIGMGYIKLGQPTPTLSGGEAQRIKLAKEIGRRRKGNILYVLDEPTTGLSLFDTGKLIQLLNELVAQGNSVIVIEHDPVVLSLCDWLIELGPGGGTEGGEIIAEGSPRTLKKNRNSKTGKYLKFPKANNAK